MQNFFNHISTTSYGMVRYTQWNYVKDGLLRNLQTAKTYYKNRVMSVRSNHFLVTLINSINVPQSLEVSRYYDNVDAKALKLSMALRMTSAIYRGATFKGVFYGPACTEIITATDEPFDPYEVDRNWRDVTAVRVIKHPYSDMNMHLPNGKVQSAESGPAVIVVNVPMLAVQFRAWSNYQISLNSSEVDSDNAGYASVATFVHMFVLPNMLDSHLDHCIVNRLINRLVGAPFGETKRSHPFVMFDYTQKIDDIHEDMVADISKRKMEYKAILKTIPVASAEDAEVLMRLPENAPTRAIFWTELLARIDVVDFLITLSNPSMNQSVNNYFIREFLSFNADKSLTSYLPYGEYLDLKNKIRSAGKKLGTGWLA